MSLKKCLSPVQYRWKVTQPPPILPIVNILINQELINIVNIIYYSYIYIIIIEKSDLSASATDFNAECLSTKSTKNLKQLLIFDHTKQICYKVDFLNTPSYNLLRGSFFPFLLESLKTKTLINCLKNCFVEKLKNYTSCKYCPFKVCFDNCSQIKFAAREIQHFCGSSIKILEKCPT